MGVGFEAEFVLERHGEGQDEVYGSEFCEQVVFAQLARSLVDVDPDVAGQVARLD